MKILQDEESGKTEDNLNPSERRGLNSLRKRVKEGKIVLVQTDKSWRLAVLTREQYQETGEPHLKDTTEIGLGFLRTNQSILNGHMSWWAAILNLGANWNQEDRCKANLLNHGLSVCPMRLLYKDHKYWTTDLGVPPPTRSIVGGNKGGNMGMSELVSVIMEPIAN